MPAPIKSSQEMAKLASHEANLVGLALLGEAKLEINKEGAIVSSSGKFKQYTVEEASHIAQAAVHNLIRVARDLKPEPFNPKNKEQRALLEQHVAYVNAIIGALAGPQEDRADNVDYALSALAELSQNSIALITNQKDVDNSCELPRVILEGDDNVLHTRAAFEGIAMHMEALNNARERFVGAKVDLVLPQWQGTPKSELSTTFREGEFNAYMAKLSQFLMQQEVMAQLEYVKWCQANGKNVNEHAVIGEHAKAILEEQAKGVSAPTLE